MDRTLLNGTVGTALVRAGETGTALGRRVAHEVGSVNWNQLVPEARNLLNVGAKLALARQGLRVVTQTTRRHPVAAAATAAALAGIGVAVWLTRRRREAVIEAGAVKKPARKRSAAKTSTARKSASKSTAKKASTAKKPAARKSTARKSATKSAAKRAARMARGHTTRRIGSVEPQASASAGANSATASRPVSRRQRALADQLRR